MHAAFYTVLSLMDEPFKSFERIWLMDFAEILGSHVTYALKASSAFPFQINHLTYLLT